MSRLFILIALIGGSIAWYKYHRLAPEDRKKWLQKSAVITVILFFAYLIMSGRLSIVFALLAAFIPLIRKALSLASYWPFIQKLWRHKSVLTPSSQGPNQHAEGKTSTVRTKLLLMTLDHSNGQIEGEVLVGQYQGKQLRELTIVQLAELYSCCPESEQDTHQLLDTYLNKMRSSEWQAFKERQQHTSRSSNDPMTVVEAAEVLGVKETASKQDIIDAHRRLMAKLHPDKGGSSYLAIQVNAAKDVLLARVKT